MADELQSPIDGVSDPHGRAFERADRGEGPGRGPEEHWHDALAAGRLLLQRSRSSGRVVFPPRVMEPNGGARDLEWFEAEGSGTVYACTVMYPRAPAAPYNVVLVDLDEGARMMSRVDCIPPEDAKIGMRVRARIKSEEGRFLVAFEAA